MNTLAHNALIIDNDDSKPYLKDNTPTTLGSFLPLESEPVTTTFRTAAATKGSVDSSVSKQWMNRPDDEKYLDLNSMKNALTKRFTECRTVEVNSKQLEFNPDMQVMLPDREQGLNLTNWTYSQLCTMANAPIGYLKTLPSELASNCLRHGIANKNNDTIKALLNVESNELRAINSATYGRIWDYQVLEQVMKIAGNGVDETCWKVPGQINWSTSNGTTVEYNPFVDVTTETTTLYASDRDVFIFLCDDTHPIEIGKLANGEPDLMFRGFYVSNSETGAGTFDLNCMMMRGVCQNRNIWGVENAQSIKFRHSTKAPDKFIQQAFPMLAAYAMSPTTGILAKVRAAKEAIVAKNDEERVTFLMGSKVGLSKTVCDAVLNKCLLEEQKPLESVWDAVQGMTAFARSIKHQNERVDLETKAGKLMNKVSA